jgi:hypothetical protein
MNFKNLFMQHRYRISTSGQCSTIITASAIHLFTGIMGTEVNEDLRICTPRYPLQPSVQTNVQTIIIIHHDLRRTWRACSRIRSSALFHRRSPILCIVNTYLVPSAFRPHFMQLIHRRCRLHRDLNRFAQCQSRSMHMCC